ncbi:MAG TPA: PepSY domain-containing protein [Steroidobacteraceae bacterium]|nr:PepSY domain-containing protein [Steroidobacteraceae bacterium]
MTTPRSLLALAACLAVSLGLLSPDIASAAGRDRDNDRDDNRGRDRGRELDDEDRRPSGRVMSLDEAMAQAEKRYRARAVHGEEQRRGDRIIYRIRLLDKDGRVFEVSIDAGSGRDR